jgi:hypothetical protein
MDRVHALIAFYSAAQGEAEKKARHYSRRLYRGDVEKARRAMLRASCFSVFVKDLRGLLNDTPHPAA